MITKTAVKNDSYDS